MTPRVPAAAPPSSLFTPAGRGTSIAPGSSAAAHSLLETARLLRSRRPRPALGGCDRAPRNRCLLFTGRLLFVITLLNKGRIPAGTSGPVRQAIADSILPDRRTSLEVSTMNVQRARAAACVCSWVVTLVVAGKPARASDGPREPLHTRIDRLMDADPIGPPVAPASDAEFLRRVSLDLAGMPPSVEELRAFLADQAA